MSIRPHNQTIKNQFLQELDASIKNQTFISLLMMNQKDGVGEISKIFVRLVLLKRGLMLSFVGRISNNDSTKNYTIDIGLKKIDELLENTFAQCELATTEAEYYLAYPEKGKGKLKKKTRKEQSELTANNSVKNSNIKSDKNYLVALGVIDENGKVIKRDKYRQIKKFVDVIDPILLKSGLQENIRVVDMGSGKGYLSFALFDHLQRTLKYKPHLTGIELRADLVSLCNDLAAKAGFDDLVFKQGSIETTPIEKPDILIALHACNTATDDAIAKGIHADAKLIICSPCCHKQVRKQMMPDTEISSIVQYGILKERQAEIVTDTIRALILKAYGYKTNVMEFISTDHTPKNLLIVAVKEENVVEPNQSYLEEIAALKKLFGITTHHLERLTYERMS